MQMARPRVFVELGAHYGDSYLALCQGAAAAKIQGVRGFAVDTWQGDAQAGFYGPDVLQSLRSLHDPRYAEFSTLLQMTFDEAVARFDAGQIDLLHIDG